MPAPFHPYCCTPGCLFLPPRQACRSTYLPPCACFVVGLAHSFPSHRLRNPERSCPSFLTASCFCSPAMARGKSSSYRCGASAPSLQTFYIVCVPLGACLSRPRCAYRMHCSLSSSRLSSQNLHLRSTCDAEDFINWPKTTPTNRPPSSRRELLYHLLLVSHLSCKTLHRPLWSSLCIVMLQLSAVAGPH